MGKHPEGELLILSQPAIPSSQFPSGYYGHFRAKSRADLCQYFRQLARPDPPKKFFDRHQVNILRFHLNEALVYSNILGRSGDTHVLSTR